MDTIYGKGILMNKYLRIYGAKEHNLKGFDVSVMHNKLTVITGVSGSGKSSLAYDIIFKEGQRRYLESLSAYSRQFLDKAGRPDFDRIEGMHPAVAISQKSLRSSARSTVGTITGIYDYIRLLFARYGKSGAEVKLQRSLFSFNSSFGACEECKGLGVVDEIDEQLLIKDENLTIREGAFEMTTPSGYIVYSQVTMDVLNDVCEAHGFNVDIAWKDLSEEEKSIVLYGSEKLKVPFGKHTLESRMKWSGITARPREEGYYKGIMTIMSDILVRDRNKNILRFAKTLTCHKCGGKRLKREALGVRYRGFGIDHLAEMSLADIVKTADEILAENDVQKGEKIIWNNIRARCATGTGIGLGHLHLNRGSDTISGGEGQRLKILTLSANVMRDMIYVFDEPSIGLHQVELSALVKLLRELRDNGNTIIVVEHDPLIIKACDQIIDIGPGAGNAGGELIFSGSISDFLSENNDKSLTRKHLMADVREVYSKRQCQGVIKIRGARAHNLMGIDVSFGIGQLNVITGVSGAGKTSLAEEVLIKGIRDGKGEFESISDGDDISRIIRIDQKPIGRSPRSNAATYTGLMDELRDILAKVPDAKMLGLRKGDFSFNTKGGRCEKCEGAGVLKLGMHFLDDILMTCPECHGKRFNEQVLQIKWQNFNIAELLAMSVTDMRKIIGGESKGGRILKTLEEVGLGYLTLGQPATTISGGEAQRIKLATELARSSKKGTLYYLDEPTTGLHGHDTGKLMRVLEGLVDSGNTVVVIEHDPDVICRADRIIDLGPGSGANGGELLFCGDVETLRQIKENNTAKALRGEIELESREEEFGENENIEFRNVTTNNLQHIDVDIPRNCLTVLTGVSGSGKSSLAFDSIYTEGWQRYVENLPSYSGSNMASVERGELETVSGLGAMLALKQERSPVNRRSTVGTFSGIYDHLRLLYSRDSEGERLTAGDFSFNNPEGACEQCKGLGTHLSCDPHKLISHPERSIFLGAMDGNKRGKYYGEAKGQYLATLKCVAHELSLDLEKPWKELGEKEKQIVMFGTGEREYDVLWEYERGKRQGEHKFHSDWKGFAHLIDIEYERVHQKRAAADLLNVMSEEKCPLCQGKRLKERMLKVKVAGMDIAEMNRLELTELSKLFEERKSGKGAVWELMAPEILRPLAAIIKVGLGYLNLERRVETLSGGEFQRLRIAVQLVSGLSGVTYILDEVSRGLHYNERQQVIKLVKELVENGNTVIAVEHDEQFIRQADKIIELGPGAGREGGRIICEGSLAKIIASSNSIIKDYLQMAKQPNTGTKSAAGALQLINCRKNNLKVKELNIPTGMLVGICGVSGSGKSTLCEEVIYQSYLSGRAEGCEQITGLDNFDRVIFKEQKALFKSGLSTPATYLGFLKEIGKIIASEAKKNGVTIAANIFNYAGKQGQCEDCKGMGIIKQELDFAGYINSSCELCGGSRYREDVLQYKYKGNNIAEILALTITEAAEFFGEHQKLSKLLAETQELGLGYLQLGQSSSTLSGGEGQRMILAAALQKMKREERCLIILDEPAAGLHPLDIKRLTEFLEKLVDNRHTVIFIDHNMQLLIKTDWLIELGPAGGGAGGKKIFEGRLAELKEADTPTGIALRNYLEN